jgi:flagellar hook-associated protein 2
MAGLQSIQGLISGLNTTEIIDALISAERKPATLMEARQAEITKEVSSFKALSAKILALQTAIGGLSGAAALNQASISISNEDLLTATANGTVSSGTYNLNILSLAKNHQIASQGFSDAAQTVFGTGSITLALGSRSATTIQIAAGENSLVGIKNAINDAKIGITASIINDGSASNPYRLVLIGGETGQSNKITVTSALTGGQNFNFATASFDNPETMDFSSQATSQVALGATASYTGSVNKTFTFTVGGNGVQTIGQGNIALTWSDGTNQGTIVVSQADAEISGPEGLKLTFTDGALVGGDTFQVSTFAPLLQQASDARVSIGSTDGDGSPIVIRSATNQIKEAIPGVTLNLKNVTTETTGPVTIDTGVDTSAVRDKINTFLKAYNDAMKYIEDQSQYDTETKASGVLMGDATLMTIQSRIRRLVGQPVKGLDQTLNALSAIGIRTDSTGQLALKDSTKLTQALENDYDAVIKLFTDAGSSTREGISFVSGSSKITGGSTFAVDITQAATHGYLQGQTITNPASSPLTLTTANNKLKLRIDGVVSGELVLSPRTYTSGTDLANELQTRINADTKIGNRGISVEWVDLGDTGYLKMSSSTYGSTSKVELITSISNNALSPLGLATAVNHAGENVAGTINGEKATGQGQYLTGKDGNTTTSGLKLLVTLDSNQLVDGSDGDITVTRGVASLFKDMLDGITDSEEGVIARKTSGLERQIEDIKQQITDFDARLAKRRLALETQFQNMETVLSQLQSQGSFLESQLNQISANTSSILSNSKG